MKNIFTIILIFATTCGFSHKYYVSIANLEYNEEEKKIDCSLKMTAHDFEFLLEKKYNKRMHLEEVADTSEAGNFIIEYLNENFQIWSGGKQAVQEYVGKEITLRDELYFYISFWGIVEPNGIKVKNSLLCKSFAKQQNIVHYRYKDQTKTVTLVPSKTESEILMD